MLSEWAAGVDNIEFKGAYGGFNRLPIKEYGAFLYTSLWDGIPNVLLEAAAAGLPLVASGVGGIHELVDEQTGWLVKDVEEVEPYVAALRQVWADRELRDSKLAHMRKRLAEQHDWESFKRVLLETGMVEVNR